MGERLSGFFRPFLYCVLPRLSSCHSFLVHGDSPQSGLLRVVRNRDGELLEVGDDLIRRTDRRELNRVF